MLLADRITLARLFIAPAAVAAYLLLPIDGQACFWAAGWICGAAETTDWLDGKVARARNEVSDFGKLADPFCDVFYRMLAYLALLLPAGGVGYAVSAAEAAGLQQSVFLVGTAADGTAILGAGLMPWLPVVLMVMREIVQGAVRAMCAARGLVLAARTSGKVKAWVQGAVLIIAIGSSSAGRPGCCMPRPGAAGLPPSSAWARWPSTSGSTAGCLPRSPAAPPERP